MQLNKKSIIKTDNDLLIINLQQSKQSNLNHNKLPLLKLSYTPQKKQNQSFHQHTNKVSSDSVSQQNFKTTRARSITLNKKNNSELIQPIPQQYLPKQLFVQKLNFQEMFEKNQQQNRFCIKNQIQSEKNNICSLKKRKLYEVLNTKKNCTEQTLDNQIYTKNNNFKQGIYKKKQTFQCFQKIIPKYHQEYTKQLIKQLPKLLENDNYLFQEKQYKCQTDYEVTLNMSEIKEMNEDGLSSIAQSTFCNKVF